MEMSPFPEAGAAVDGLVTVPSGLGESLRAAERRLQAAQLTSDLSVLAELLDDGLLFTGPDGNLATKADDLGAHRRGDQVLCGLEEQDLRLSVFGWTGVTWFLGLLEGSFGGQLVTARMRYTRTWAYDDQKGWRVVAAHASVIDSN